LSVARVVTLAELYGAGGSAIGRRVADRLGVRFFDHRILSAVAHRAGLPEAAVAEVDDEPRPLWNRLFDALGRASPPSGASDQVERLDLQEHDLRREIERALADVSRSGAVVLGRGGAIVLASVPEALHVHLGGNRDRRIERVMKLRELDRASAVREVHRHDHARRDYVKNVYGDDVNDPALYHLMIDTISLGVDVCVDLIVAASDSLAGHSAVGTSATG
jgi:cytidylate kinase